MTRAVRRLRVALAAAFAVLPMAGAAQSQDDAVSRADHGAYEWSLKCFVLDSKAANDRRSAGDTSKADVYDKLARKAFDMAFAAGGRIGLSDDRVNRDMTFTQTQELPPLIQDDSYFRKTAANCKALGLL